MTNELELLVKEMVAVAGGGNAQELRSMVQRLMPKTIEDADLFVAFMKRLRLAADAAENAATEAYAAVRRG